MKMKTLLIGTSWFVCFLVGIGGVVFFRYENVRFVRAQAPVFSPQASTFDALPPAEAMIANIISITGDVQVATRDQNGLSTPSAGLTTGLTAGEEIITGKDGEMILEYPGFAKIIVAKNADISLSNPLSKTFLITQKSGDVRYQLETSADATPVSVRIDGALIQLDAGNHVVSIVAQTAGQPAATTLETIDGSAQIGLVNKQNATQTWTVTAGQIAKISSKEQTVEIQ